MCPAIQTIILPDTDATAQFAVRIGNLLNPGDTLLLDGEIGAGKTFFARALIHSLQEAPEDVPSPTYTLVQTYLTSRGEVVHADLYRLSTSDEVVELGLSDAFQSAIVLVEWPDRLGADAPAEALQLRFETGSGETERRVTMTGSRHRWGERLGILQDA